MRNVEIAKLMNCTTQYVSTIRSEVASEQIEKSEVLKIKRDKERAKINAKIRDDEFNELLMATTTFSHIYTEKELEFLKKRYQYLKRVQKKGEQC